MKNKSKSVVSNNSNLSEYILTIDLLAFSLSHQQPKWNRTFARSAPTTTLRLALNLKNSCRDKSAPRNYALLNSGTVLDPCKQTCECSHWPIRQYSVADHRSQITCVEVGWDNNRECAEGLSLIA